MRKFKTWRTPRYTFSLWTLSRSEKNSFSKVTTANFALLGVLVWFRSCCVHKLLPGSLKSSRDVRRNPGISIILIATTQSLSTLILPIFCFRVNHNQVMMGQNIVNWPEANWNTEYHGITPQNYFLYNYLITWITIISKQHLPVTNKKTWATAKMKNCFRRYHKLTVMAAKHKFSHNSTILNF